MLLPVKPASGQEDKQDGEYEQDAFFQQMIIRCEQAVLYNDCFAGTPELFRANSNQVGPGVLNISLFTGADPILTIAANGSSS